MTYLNRTYLLAGAATFALCAATLASSAYAQSQDTGGRVSEVVVTAQRRAESVQDVPIAITTQTAEALEKANIQTYADIATVTPGLQFQAIGATAMPFLRGVGATTSAAGSESGVALYVDDVYISSTPASLMALNNIESVAVLRGPQGTLFGRNATGGVVQITTRTPDDTFRLDASAGIANHETYEGGLYISGPVMNRVAADLAVFARTNQGGWGKNLATGEDAFISDDFAARTRWELELGEATRLTLIGQHFRIKTQGGFASTRLNPGEVGQVERYAGGRVATEDFYDIDLNDTSGSSTRVWSASAKLFHSFGWADFKSITAYNYMSYVGFVDFDFTGGPGGTVVRIPPTTDTYSQEFQLSSSNPESPFTWVTGVYLYKDIAEYHNQLTLVRGAFTQFLNSKQDTESYSVFAQGDYKVTDATQITLGVRYNNDQRDFTGSTLTIPVVGAPAFVPVTGKKKFPGTTFKVGVNHNFSEDVMAYASYTTGFKSGFFSTQTIQTFPTNPNRALPVNQETVDSVEAGVKSVLFDNRLRLNVSAFHYDYKDMQVNAFLNNTTRVTLNAGGAKIYGVDVDAEWHATDQLYFTLAAEWLHARFSNFKNAPFFTPRTAAPWGLVASIGDATDNHVTNSPEFTATVGANYDMPLAGGELTLNGSLYYNSGFYFDPMNRLKQEAFTTLGGSVKWTSPEGRYDVTLWGRNLTDEEVFASINPTVNGDAAEPREPLTFGLRVGFHY